MGQWCQFIQHENLQRTNSHSEPLNTLYPNDIFSWASPFAAYGTRRIR